MFFCAWILLLVVLPLSLSIAKGDFYFLHGWRLAYYGILLPLNYKGFRKDWVVVVNYWKTRLLDD